MRAGRNAIRGGNGCRRSCGALLAQPSGFFIFDFHGYFATAFYHNMQ